MIKLLDYCNILMTSELKLVSAKTGRLLLLHADRHDNLQKYGDLDVVGTYATIETSGHKKDFARIQMVAYVHEAEFYAMKESINS